MILSRFVALSVSLIQKVSLLQVAIKKTYESKGVKVVQMNYNAVDSVAEDDGTRLRKVDYPARFDLI